MTAEIKVGMVGLDTSHCEVFAKMLHDQEFEYHLPGVRIVGAYPGGSAQFSKSRERVQGYTDTLHKVYGVKLYNSLATLVDAVDAIFLESVDGRQHPEQFDQLAVGKPVFIDKPFAVSAADARTIIHKAQATHTPIMSCSSLRYAAGIAELISADEKVVAGETFGPALLLDDFPGLFWYGIHSAEVLSALMGTGCKQVQCMERGDMDIVIGDWVDGRLGLMRGTRVGTSQFGCVVHTTQGVKCSLAQATPPSYYLMLREILPFFRSGVSPIDIEETYEITAFLEAAEQSRARSSQVVALEAL
jgi:hypothetical protein